MALFDQWDNFDFENSSDRMYDEMIRRGAEFGLDAGLTQTRTKQELRDRGFSFGNDRFSNLWRGLAEEQAGFNHFTTIGVNDLPFDEVLPQKTYFSTKYRYVGSFEAINEFGVNSGRITLAIDSNKSLTPNEALAILKDISVRSYGASDEEVDNLQLQGALFNPTV